MPFEFLPSFVTGTSQLDEEHRELVTRVNAIAAFEHAGDTAGLLKALAVFRADLAAHFAAEEAQLVRVGYPKHSSHATHHAETIVALDRLVDGLERGEPPHEVAETCFHELISNLILEDMQFLNWLADHPHAKA